MQLKPNDIELMTTWRHQIHAHPELGFEEIKTSQLVIDLLTEWGYLLHTGLAGTGVVAQKVFGSGTGPRIGIRADMDALPIQEDTGHAWQSQNPGVMHACGHDGHTAILLGAAKKISEMETSEFNGTLNLIFQPAEEMGGGGGAQRMIDEGLFGLFPCDQIFALHNLPGLPTGKVEFASGPLMTSSDIVNLKFIGKGGHGAFPQMTYDPTLPLANTIIGLQSIVGRNIDPLNTGVISVGKVEAGEAYNIIPESANLVLSVRALQPSVRQELEERIRSLATGQAQSYNCSVEIDYQYGYPVLVNDIKSAEQIGEIAKSVFGAENVNTDAKPLTASEDFAFMLQQVPGCYLFIGNGDNGYKAAQRIGPCHVHNPYYDFNDEALPVGAAIWLKLVDYFFKSTSKA